MATKDERPDQGAPHRDLPAKKGGGDSGAPSAQQGPTGRTGRDGADSGMSGAGHSGGRSGASPQVPTGGGVDNPIPSQEQAAGAAHKAASTMGASAQTADRVSNAAGSTARVAGEGLTVARAAEGDVTAMAQTAKNAAQHGREGASELADMTLTEDPTKDGVHGGASGTAVHDPDTDDSEKGVSGSQKAAAGAAAAGTATVAAPAAMMIAVLAWLRAMFFQVMSILMSLWQAIWATILYIGGKILAPLAWAANTGANVMSFVFGGGGGVALTGQLIGGTTAAVSFVTAFALLFAGITTGSGGAASDDASDPCANQALSDVAQAVTTAMTGQQGSGSAAEMATAQQVFSVLLATGMSKENVAGILGNAYAESGTDPFAVETISDEPHTLGPKKQAAQATGFAKPTSGIGLFQWSFARNKMLRDFAAKTGKPWTDAGVQMAFMLTADSDAATVKAMETQPLGTPEAAAEFFMTKWERPASMSSLGVRQAAAKRYMAASGAWQADKNQLDSLLAQANQAGAASPSGGDTATGNDAATAQNASSGSTNQCQDASTAGGFDNSSDAAAAVSYAWPTEQQAKTPNGTPVTPRRNNAAPGTATGNDGTPLYQELHKKIFPGDPWFQSCDRSVATAVRWSDTDDNYPPGAVADQLSYLNGAGASKWTKVDFNGDQSKLQPGDVLLRNDGNVSHTIMYVGHDLIAKKFGNKATPDSVIISGSLGTRSPGAGKWIPEYNTFAAYRAKGKDSGNKYSSMQLQNGSMMQVQEAGAGTPGALSQPIPTSDQARSYPQAYAPGNCTAYAFGRRKVLGLPVESNWGDARNWGPAAAKAGYQVDKSPSPGAIYTTTHGGQGHGHVAIVEKVNGDGSFFVSEMNVKGKFVVSTRTMQNNDPAEVSFIHGKAGQTV